MATKNEIVVAEPGGLTLVQFIDTLTEAHLEELRAEISRTQNRLNGMKKLAGVVAAALGKSEPRKPKKKEDREARVVSDIEMADKRKRIATFLGSGYKNGQEVIRQCGVQPAMLATFMSCPYFRQTDQGWQLTAEGRQKYGVR